MKLKDATEFIKECGGYRVEFERQEGAILASDHFPDDNETPIQSEGEAWKLAIGFAKAGKNRGIVNVYVIYANDYTPVKDYKNKELNLYPYKREELIDPIEEKKLVEYQMDDKARGRF